MRKVLLFSLLLGLLPWLAWAQQPAPPPSAPASAQTRNHSPNIQLAPPRLPHRGGAFAFWNDYRPLPPLILPGANPAVLAYAERTGKLPLSLRQAVQLTLADNLNLLADNYDRLKAQIDVLRTQSGAAARGFSGASISNSLFSGAIGASNNGGGNGGGGGGGGFSGGGNLYTPGGGSFDPQISVSMFSIHSKYPLNSQLLYGIPVEEDNFQLVDASYIQGFPTGTTFGVNVNGMRDYINTNALLFNPDVYTTLSIGFSQQLLRGFGGAANRGFMKTAANDTHIAASIYRQKVMQRAAAAADRYWKLAEAQRLAALAAQATAATRQLAADTRRLVRAGRKPQSDQITVETQLAQAREAQLTAETNASTRAMVLELHLSRRLSPALLAAQVQTLNRLPSYRRRAAGEDPPPTLAQVVNLAVANSPVLEQERYKLANADIALATTRNALLPSLTVGGSWITYGLSGVRCRVSQTPCPSGQVLSNGFTQALSQNFHSSYPDYGAGFSLSFPLFNRQARADHARAEVDSSQRKLRYRARENQVAQKAAAAYIAWQNAALALRQSRAQLRLARQTYANARYKYRYGRASILDVIAAAQAENAAATADAAARLDYALAQDKLDRRTGAILARFAVRIRPLPPPRLGR